MLQSASDSLIMASYKQFYFLERKNMNEYTVILDFSSEEYPEYVEFIVKGDSYADAEAVALNAYYFDCEIVSICKNKK